VAADLSPPATQDSIAVVSFTVKPRRAHIFVNGTELAGTSTDIPLPGGTATIEVTVKKSGYRSHSENYTLTGDQNIEVSLVRRERRDDSVGPGSLLDIR
jgi:Cadherin-like beta sandwich domain/PEGA domain